MNESKTALITGATAGIGEAAAMELASRGYKLILLSRNPLKLGDIKREILKETANEDIYTVLCDLSSQKSIRKAAEEINKDFSVIDILINNAGINTASFELTVDGMEKTFAINHLAYFLLTGLLLKNVKRAKEGRIINVSSNGHYKVDLDIDKLRNNSYKGRYATYRRSKLANVMFTIDLAQKLRGSGVTVNSVHPGLVNTDIGKEDPGIGRKFVNFLKSYIALTPEQGADTIIYLATSPEVRSVTGKYFEKRRIKPHSRAADNLNIRKKLWDLSEKLSNFDY